jgi:hypothetical protein
MNVTENVVYEDEQVQKNLVERLKSLTVEPRDNTRLRIVLLAPVGTLQDVSLMVTQLWLPRHFTG